MRILSADFRFGIVEGDQSREMTALVDTGST